MTEVELTESALLVHVRGADKFWEFKSQLEIPLTRVVSVAVDPVHREYDIWKMWGPDIEVKVDEDYNPCSNCYGGIIGKRIYS